MWQMDTQHESLRNNNNNNGSSKSNFFCLQKYAFQAYAKRTSLSICVEIVLQHFSRFNHELKETWISSSHRTLFQADSDEICWHFSKTITLPSVLQTRLLISTSPSVNIPVSPRFFKTFDGRCLSACHFAKLLSPSSTLHLENLLNPKIDWVGRSWAVARRFVPLSSRMAEKTIAIVFQIRLKLVSAKCSFQSPDRT